MQEINELNRGSIRKIPKIIGIVLAILIIIAGIFYGGVVIGKKYYPSINLIQGLENKESGQPADVDFSLFWDAWRVVQSDYLKSDSLDRQEMVYGAVKGLMGSLDQHSAFLTPEEASIFKEDAGGSFGGVGMEIGLRDNWLTVVSPLEDTPAWRVGLQAKDTITEINGESTQGITTGEAVQKIRGPEGTEVVLTIMRDSFNKPKEFSIIRDIIVVFPTKLEFLDGNIAHLKLNSFSETAPYNFYLSAVKILKKNSPGIILDMRNNPGGLLDVSVDIAGWMIKKGDVVTIENLKDEEEILKADGNSALSDIPMVVIVNEGSASASEILAGALRDNRGVKIVGKTTYGKGSVQRIKNMFDDSLVKITIAEWLTPNGDSINENGIDPDYEVEMPEDWKRGDLDPQLEKALDILRGEMM